LKKLLIALIALFAVIAPLPQKADASLGYVVASTCGDVAAQSAGGSYYICYDISAESAAVYRSTGSPNWVWSYQAGPYLTVGSRQLPPTLPLPGPPTRGGYWGSNECIGADFLAVGKAVGMQPTSLGQYGWGNQNVYLRAGNSPQYDWMVPQFTLNQVNTLIVYANETIPSYRCVVVP